MAVKKGYKQTEVGMIPEDWEITFVEEVAEITTGGKNTQDRIDDGIYPFFVRSQTVERINSYSFDGEAVLTAGDGVGTGKVFHYINGKFDTHQRVYRMTGFGTRVNGYFFFLYFSNYFYSRIMQMTAKSSVDSVRRDMIARMKIPLPPTLAEQEAIAGALSDADAWIESLEQLIAKKRQIKQGAMQELLTGKRRLPGFSGKWETKRLGDLGSFLKGSGVRKNEANSGDIPCVRYGEIYTHHNDYIRRFNSSISRDVAETATRLNYGDLLFAGSGETKADIGKCVAYAHNMDAYAGGDIVILRSTKFAPVFMGYYCNTRAIAEQKAARGQGDAVVHISSLALAGVQICVPEIHEQTAIATVLSDMDTEIESLESKLAKASEIKQGMMQELLTGKIRLVKSSAVSANQQEMSHVR
jgi:type I restriction enzyme S subunit